MRADVKLGIVISLIMVTVAGGYYLYRDKNDKPIQLVAGPDTFADQLPLGGKSPVASKTSTPKKRSSSKTPSARNAKNAPRTKLPAARTPTGDPSRVAMNKKTPVRSSTQQSKSKLGAKRPPTNNATGKLADTTRPISTRSNPKVRPSRTANSKPASTNRNNATKRTSSMIAVETHRVQPGDTMATIAEGYYGNPALASFLASANPHVRAGSALTPGQLIKIPEQPAGSVVMTTKHRPSLAATRPQTKQTKPKRKPAVTKPKTYRVKSGDSFYKIAKTQLGNASRWKEIFELNKKVVSADPKRLKPGQVLELPD